MENYQGITGRKSNTLSIIFFMLGLIGAIGLRVILWVNNWNALWGKFVWYLAMISYIVFYSYRYYIEEKRRDLIIYNKLRQKLYSNEDISSEDRRKLRTVLDSIMVSKWRLNLIILIVISIIVLAIQLMLDLL
ncbi:MAG: hypothetical protein KKA64_01880 [Nanoarchaeota archaeon]|nr:hypothetical protein [Nanoarchaeota archaeon]